jgi:hypothetical protein
MAHAIAQKAYQRIAILLESAELCWDLQVDASLIETPGCDRRYQSTLFEASCGTSAKKSGKWHPRDIKMVLRRWLCELVNLG